MLPPHVRGILSKPRYSSWWHSSRFGLHAMIISIEAQNFLSKNGKSSQLRIVQSSDGHSEALRLSDYPLLFLRKSTWLKSVILKATSDNPNFLFDHQVRIHLVDSTTRDYLLAYSSGRLWNKISTIAQSRPQSYPNWAPCSQLPSLTPNLALHQTQSCLGDAPRHLSPAV